MIKYLYMSSTIDTAFAKSLQCYDAKINEDLEDGIVLISTTSAAVFLSESQIIGSEDLLLRALEPLSSYDNKVALFQETKLTEAVFYERQTPLHRMGIKPMLVENGDHAARLLERMRKLNVKKMKIEEHNHTPQDSLATIHHISTGKATKMVAKFDDIVTVSNKVRKTFHSFPEFIFS